MSNDRQVHIHKVPLRLLLVVPFVLQIFTVVGLTGWISLRNGQKAVNDLATQLRSEVTARIEQKLLDHLKIAPLVNQINIDAIQLDSLDLTDQAFVKRYLLNQLKQFNQLSGITLATEDPNYAGIAYDEQGIRILTLWNLQKGGSIDLTLDSQGSITSAESDLKYDHRQRPWYQTTVKAKRPIWQEPYVTLNPQRLVISADQPFYNRENQLLGVADAELTLASISDFLSSIRIGRSGQTFIIERDGELIATSTSQQPFLINSKTQEPERLLASKSNDRLISQTAHFLTDKFGSLTQIRSSQQLEFSLDNQRFYVQVMPFHDQQGIDWLVIVTVPEADFMEAINANTRITILLCLAALILATLMGLFTSQHLIKPILGLASAAEALSKGNWSQPLPKPRFDELRQLSDAFNHMAEQLQMSFGALQYNAHHDALTGLLNQTAFRLRLRESIARRDYLTNHSASHSDIGTGTGQADNNQAEYCFAVLFLDLDYFKLVNDSLGHLIGDRLLIAVTDRLKTCISEYQIDLQSDEIVNQSKNALSRFGGDEFVILIDPAKNISDATRLADQISHKLRVPFNIDGNEVFITTSIGIVMSTNGGAQPESFLRNADIALYRAKVNGKASYEVFDADMHTQVVDRLQLETDLRRAIEQQELEVYYQPIIDSHTYQIVGFEALLRWQHPVQGWISPMEFIPIAEETGLIVQLGVWTLHQACQQMKTWQQQFAACEAMSISVNLSSRQFFQANFLQQVEQVLLQTELAPQNLKLEITESIFMNPGEPTRAKLKRLEQSGVQLSIDDFGTGYSSLSYLHRFPIDTLKIDRSFVQQLESSHNGEIVEAIVVLAHKLGMAVVAEGVETVEQLYQLRKIGCEQVQGFLFSRPVDTAQITDQLASGVILKLRGEVKHV
jgi:diguanylate cyclase (GGDEF)-like protein